MKIQTSLCGVCLNREWRVSPSRSYRGDVSIFGIALIETQPGSRHTGIVVEAPQLGGKRFLHLAWHYAFLNDAVEPGYSEYSGDNFTDEEREYLAERVIRRWERNGSKVAYGLDYDGTPAFDNADMFDGRGGRGLTCATFVLDFLASCGFAICDVGSWRFRSEDRKFQQFVYDALSRRLVGHENQDQLKRVKASIGNAARFRPEEVAACFVRYDNDPIQMLPAQFWGHEVVAEANMTLI